MGHSLYFEDYADAQNHTLNISGGPFPDENKTFYLHQLHWHWGEKDDEGSEHSIAGLKYPMELHLVHSDAQNHSVVVLSFLYEISETKNPGLDKLIDYIEEIAREGSDGVDHVIKPDHSIKISDFLPLDMKTQT